MIQVLYQASFFLETETFGMYCKIHHSKLLKLFRSDVQERCHYSFFSAYFFGLDEFCTLSYTGRCVKIRNLKELLISFLLL